ncbi:MAG: hypothetical protein JJU00_20470, partial [Opitutales bacterium]|nr:hypothetical protein [Opitutales bacterium]
MCAPNRFPRVLSAALSLILPSCGLFASVVEKPTYVPVTVTLSGDVPSGGMLSFSLTDVKEETIEDFEITDSEDSVSDIVWMHVGGTVDVEFVNTGTNVSNVEVEFRGPAGFETLVDGVRIAHFIASDIAGGESFEVSVRQTSAWRGAAAAGNLSLDDTLGGVNFGFGLGTLSDGTSAGPIEIREPPARLGSDFEAFQARSILRYPKTAGADEEIDVVLDGPGLLRQVRTHSVLADIQDLPDGSGFEIRYFQRGEYQMYKTGGTYGGLGNPFMTYKVTAADPGADKGRLVVERRYGGDPATAVEYTYEVENFAVGDPPAAKKWSLEDGAGLLRYEREHTGTDGAERTYRLRHVDPSDSYTEVYVADFVYKDLSHHKFGERRELVRRIEDPAGKSYTNFWTYYDGHWDGTDEHNYAKLWQQTDFRGNWSWTYYYRGESDDHTPQPGETAGMPSTVMRPFTDQYGDSSFTDYIITRHRYASHDWPGDPTKGTDDTVRTKYLPARLHTFVGGGGGPTLSDRRFLYAHHTAPDGREVLGVTVTDFTDSGASLVTQNFAYSAYLSGTDASYFRGKPYATVSADGTQRSYAYRRAKITVDFDAAAAPDSTTFAYSGSDLYGWQTIVAEGLSSGNAENGGESVTDLFGIDIGNADSALPNGIYLVPWQSMVRRVTRYGLLEISEVFVYTGGSSSTLELVSWSWVEYLPDGRPGRSLNSRGETTSVDLHSQTRRVVSSTDAQGIVTEYRYDALGRMHMSLRHGVDDKLEAMATVREWSASGNKIRESVHGVAAADVTSGNWDTKTEGEYPKIKGEAMVSEWEYDLGGRLVERVLPCGAVVGTQWEKDGVDYYNKRATTRDGHT